MHNERPTNPDKEARRQRDLERVAQIWGTPQQTEEVARVLFFDHYDGIEAKLRARFRDRGLKYDDGSPHYNAVWEEVYECVYAPEELRKAVENFDADLGSLHSWLMQRVVFAIQDWLKSTRKMRLREQPTDTSQLAAKSSEVPEMQKKSVLERALPRMTASQRACTVLRLLPARGLTKDDLTTVVKASARQEADAKRQIDDLVRKDSKTEFGLREQDLLAKLAFWHAQKLHQQRLYAIYRRKLLGSGATESELAVIESRGGRHTQEEIAAHYAVAKQNDGKTNVKHELYRRYELCCHELLRCERRLKKLNDEHAGAPNICLLSYEEIAEVLWSTVAKVTAHLNRARVHIADEENRETGEP